MRARPTGEGRTREGEREEPHMKLPALSLRIERGEDAGMGDLRAETLGVGLLLLLALDVLLGGDRGSGQMPDALRYAFCCGCTLVLLAGGVTDKRVHALFRTHAPVLAGTCVTMLGSALSITAGYVPLSLKLACQVVGGGLMGAGVGILVFLWGISFARQEVADISLNAVLGVTLGVVVFVVVSSVLALVQ